MAADTGTQTLAAPVLVRALAIWAQGHQVIPLGPVNQPTKNHQDWQRWLRHRQTRDDVEHLVGSAPSPAGIGIIECSSVFGPRVADDDDALWSRLLTEDIIHTKGVGEEWLFTANFEFFEQLETLREAKAAAIRETKAAEDKPRPPVGLPVTKVQKGDLEALFADEGAARMVVRLLGIPEWKIEAGNFLCVLPGHEEQSPSARLYQDNQSCYTYTCFHPRGDIWTTRTLPDVYYAQKIGNAEQLIGHDEDQGLARDKRRGGPLFAVWALRLLAEAGVLQPIDDVGLPALKSNVPESVHKVYDGLKLLLSVRWTYSPGDPAPFSWRFAAEWCGVSQTTAGDAIRKYLLPLGIIHRVGKDKKNTSLFLPGKAKHIHISQKRYR